jgi:hypothetical protein
VPVAGDGGNWCGTAPARRRSSVAGGRFADAASQLVTNTALTDYNEHMETVVAVFEAIAGKGLEARLGCNIPTYVMRCTGTGKGAGPNNVGLAPHSHRCVSGILSARRFITVLQLCRALCVLSVSGLRWDALLTLL